MHEKEEGLVLVVPGEITAERAPPEPGKNPALIYLALLKSERSVATQRSALRICAQLLGGELHSYRWDLLRYSHVVALARGLREARKDDGTPKYAKATFNRMMLAVRGTLKQSWLLQHISLEEYLRCKTVDLETLDKKSSGRRIPIEEFEALSRACADGTLAGSRDSAIVSVLYGCGLRRAEAADLALGDYDMAPEGPILIVREGKGRKRREQFVEEGTVAAIEAWIARRGREPGSLFYAVDKGGNLHRAGLSDSAIYRILKRRAVQAGIKRRLSPHDCRRSLATDLLDEGVDINVVKEILGHESIETTARYDHRSKKAQAAGMKKIRVPYVAPKVS